MGTIPTIAPMAVLTNPIWFGRWAAGTFRRPRRTSPSPHVVRRGGGRRAERRRCAGL